jgi:hypothetical protein
VFGSIAYAKVMPVPAKLEPQLQKAVMVGYQGTAGYHLWDPQARKFFRSHDVVFEEGTGHWSRAPAGGDVDGAGVDDILHAPIPSHIEPTDAPATSDDGNDTPSVPVPDAPEPELRCSAHMHAPSKALQDSCASQAEEAAAKAAHEPWARGDGKPAKKPQAVAALNT